MDSEKKLLKAPDVGQRLDVKTRRVYELSRNGEFDDFLVRIGEKQYRYKPDGLERYISRGGRHKESAAVAA